MPTNPYDYAWDLLHDEYYDSEELRLAFVEGLFPEGNRRYVFLEVDVETANETCERPEIPLRFERVDDD